MKNLHVSPAIDATAFSCPHCGAYAKQTWFELFGEALPKDALPLRITETLLEEKKPFQGIEKGRERDRAELKAKKMCRGNPIIDRRDNSTYAYWDLLNTNASMCFNCNEIAIWTGSTLSWPIRPDTISPNPDLPFEIIKDFEEAGRIYRESPRGAAALLRLAVQKLCKEIGGKGKNIDDDIAFLVKNGLDVRIQRSLDIVRVVGNEAVHPGQLDLRDDIETAEKLFALVNLIAEVMISQPKHIEQMYGSLPEGKREAIERRDQSSKIT